MNVRMDLFHRNPIGTYVRKIRLVTPLSLAGYVGWLPRWAWPKAP